MPNALISADLIGKKSDGSTIIGAERKVFKCGSAHWYVTVRCACGTEFVCPYEKFKLFPRCHSCRIDASRKSRAAEMAASFPLDFNGFTATAYNPATGLYTAVCKSCGKTVQLSRHSIVGYQSCGCLAVANYVKGDTDISRSVKSGRALNRNSTSGVRGVSFRKSSGTWRAYITTHHQQISLGFFERKEDAIAARRQGEKDFFLTVLDPEDMVTPGPGYIPLSQYATEHGKTRKASTYHYQRGRFPDAVRLGTTVWVKEDTPWPENLNKTKKVK